MESHYKWDSFFVDIPKHFENAQYLDCNKERWSDVEQSMTINFNDYADSYVDAFFQDRVHPDDPEYEDKLKKIFSKKCDSSFLNDLYYFTGTCLYDWIKSIDIKSEINGLNIDNSGVFVTFNYTDTLEQLYNISEKQILHIHGRMKKINSSELQKYTILSNGNRVTEDWGQIAHFEMQFGTNKNDPEEVKGMLQNEFSKHLDEKRYADLIEECENYARVAFKNTNKNINKLETFLQNADIDKVIVMGHSLQGMDITYYENFFIPHYGNKMWSIYCHGDNGKKDAEAFITKYGLNGKIRSW